MKKRFIDYPRAGKRGVRRWIPSWKLVLGSFFSFIGLLIGLAGYALYAVDIPSEHAVAKAQKNVYFWADGSQMVVAGGGDQNRQSVDLSEVPESMQNAVISAENETFYKDRGVDPIGITRAVVNMALGGNTQSGSTITQQYVKNMYLDQSQTVTRKARELLISIKVGAKMEKDDILVGYLNSAYYGRGAYGIQAAAQAYYQKDSNELEPDESAFLSSVLNGPNIYDPAGGYQRTPEQNLKAATERWKWTLDRQVETKRMSQTERAKYQKFPMPEEPSKATELAGQIGYLVELANNDIINKSDGAITKRNLDDGGYEIHTTFDKKMMNQMEKAVEKVRKKNIKPKEREEDKFVQFGGASVVPGDGAIVAIYGGEDATKHYINNAAYTGVQVGSTFKPFVMAAALRDGKRDPDGPPDQGSSTRTQVSPKSIYNGDNRIKLLDYNGDTWLNEEDKEWHQPNDEDGDYGPIQLYKAMEVSANTPFIQLGMDVGVDKVKEAAMDAGIKDDDRSFAGLTPTFSLGTSSPSAIDLAGGYATFAKSGLQADPYAVTEVSREGQDIYVHEGQTKNAFEPAVADTVTEMLERVVKHGTGTAAQLDDGRPAAGKTGTTDGNRSAWFAGYTPQLSTAIGMWRIDSATPGATYLEMYGVGGRESVHGASFPADIWKEYMDTALKGQAKEKFVKPGPIGEKVTGTGATPPPATTQPPSSSPPPKESDEPEPPSSSPPPPTSPSPDPSETCEEWDWQCEESSGATEGTEGTSEGSDEGQDAGTDQGTDQGTDSGQDGGNDNGSSDNGGIWGNDGR